MTLAVNGAVVVGAVRTIGATYTIRPTSSGLHVVRQVNPSLLPPDVHPRKPSAPAPAAPPVATGGAKVAVSMQQAQADSDPAEESSRIDVLVLYTPAARDARGGTTGIKALIDMLIVDTNAAYRESGVHQWLHLAHSQMVTFTGTGSFGDDLRSLWNPSDGILDEAHVIRNRYAADIVHLIVRYGDDCGAAYIMNAESPWEERDAFSISRVACLGGGYTFAHELGHSMGLHHDRYESRVILDESLHPYSFGYVNQRAFEPGAPQSARWRTIMAYDLQCREQGSFGCAQLRRFSNPDLTHNGDPMGARGDERTREVAGPADARRTLNRTRRLVTSFRSRSCTNFSVSPQVRFTSLDGGLVQFTVHTTPGCLWEAESDAESLAFVSNLPGSGPGFVTVEVGATSGVAVRTSTLTVAGRPVAVRQVADAGVCGRSSLVSDAITRAVTPTANAAAACASVTDGQLAEVQFLDLRANSITALREGDFAGLTGLRSLILDSNGLRTIPARVFFGLDNLGYLDLGSNGLKALPAGVFSGLTRLNTLSLINNRLTTLPAGIFADTTRMNLLYLYENDLKTLPEYAFSSLTSLVFLDLRKNQLTTLSATVFPNSVSLRFLHLQENRLKTLPAGVFSGLSGLTSLGLIVNQLETLPAGVFSDLSSLPELRLSANLLGYGGLPAGVFSGLSSLKTLSLSYNHLTELPAGLFTGLPNLRNLILANNSLAGLPAGFFAGLSQLESLDLRFNAFEPDTKPLPAGLFAGLFDLKNASLLYSGIRFTLELERVGDTVAASSNTAAVRVILASGAPFDVAVNLSASAGTLSTDAAVITLGTTASTDITVTRNGDEPVMVSLGDVLPYRYNVRVGAPLTLFVPVVVATATATIMGPETASEGTTAIYTIHLSDAVSEAVTVTWSIAAAGDNGVQEDDFAEAGGLRRMTFPRGTVTIAPGATSASFGLPIYRDDEAEDAESFRVTLHESLSGGVRLTVPSVGSATVTTIPAHGRPVFSIAAPAAGYAVAENTTLTVVVTVDPVPAAGASVLCTIGHDGIRGTTAEADDFTFTTAVAVFTVGAAMADCSFGIVEDGRDEDVEHFTVSLSALDPGEIPGGGSYGAARGFRVAPRTVTVKARAWLQGAYDRGRGTMKTTLIDYLPASQPYHVRPWNHPPATTVPHVVNGLSDVHPAIVDWVLLELRATTQGASAATARSITNGRRAALLLNNGDVVGVRESAATAADAAETAGVRFGVEVHDGRDLYLLIHHRNHLSIMSSSSLTNASVGCDALYCVDFTREQSHEGGQREVANGVFAMVVGDIDRNGIIDSDDWGIIRANNLAAIGGDHYGSPAAAGRYVVDVDLDFDGDVLAADGIFIIVNDAATACGVCSP